MAGLLLSHHCGATQEEDRVASKSFGVDQPINGGPRLAWVQPCEIRGKGCPPDGYIWNLSATGAYVVANPIPPTGRRLRITFRLPDGSTFAGTGRVAWRNQPSPWKGCGAQSWKLPPGCGVEFLGQTRHRTPERRIHEDGLAVR